MRKWIAMAVLCCAQAAQAQQPRRTIVVARPATIGLDQPTADAFADLVRGELGFSYTKGIKGMLH